ncbi:MAG: PEP-CTERM sorting domain-containing protein [Myxococcota bacterium]
MRSAESLALALTTALLSALLCATSAAALSIDFGPSFGAPARTTVLTDQLISYGVTFSSDSPNGVVWNGQGHTINYPYVIGAGFTNGYGDTSDIRIDFLAPAQRVGIRAFDGGGDEETVTLRGFDASGQLLATRSIGPYSFNNPGSFLIIETGLAPGISYAVLETEGTMSGVFFDDLFYDPIPEPNSAILIGLGLAGLSATGRKD